jgi:hypothetical protein
MHMQRNSQRVASVDTDTYIEGITELIRTNATNGFEPYIATFLFRSLPASENASKNIMAEEITAVYGRFITEVVRNPWSGRNQTNRPIFIGCPDWPVFKGQRGRLKQQIGTSGIHFAGILLIPPINRLKMGIVDHFEHKHRVYTGAGRHLERIHIQHLDDNIPRTVDYTFKSLKRRRCEIEDVLLLPYSKA